MKTGKHHEEHGIFQLKAPQMVSKLSSLDLIQKIQLTATAHKWDLQKIQTFEDWEQRRKLRVKQ